MLQTFKKSLYKMSLLKIINYWLTFYNHKLALNNIAF